jgi:HD-like signal output (HDOD) protein
VGHAPAAPGQAGESDAADEAEFPTGVDGVGNLDTVERARARLEERERELLERIGARIASRKFELPQLPATALSVMEMAARTETDIDTIVETIAADPTLSGEFLRVANSVLFAGAVPTETLQAAVVRLGRRTIRSVTLSISMRGAIMKNKALVHYAEEVWRQSYSVAVLARVVSVRIGIEPEHGFLLGLMHDVGKVSLLSDLGKELQKSTDLSAALVGRVFAQFHELAGEAMARSWGLSDEVVSVAGQHHQFDRNLEHRRSAAMVCLAHKMDLFLSMGAESNFHALWRSPEMEALGLSEEECHQLLRDGITAFRDVGSPASAAAA